MRARMIDAAAQYLLKAQDDLQAWRGTNILYRPTFAAYRALLLLLHKDLEALAELPAEVWRKWAPIVVAYPTTNSEEQRQSHQILVWLAYQRAPDVTIATIQYAIEQDNQQGDHIKGLWKLERCWDNRLCAALLPLARDPAMKSGCVAALLDVLLKHDRTEVSRQFAESLVILHNSANEEERSKAVTAASLLMREADDVGWQVIWPAMLSNDS